MRKRGKTCSLACATRLRQQRTPAAIRHARAITAGKASARARLTKRLANIEAVLAQHGITTLRDAYRRGYFCGYNAGFARARYQQQSHIDYALSGERGAA